MHNNALLVNLDFSVDLRVVHVVTRLLYLGYYTRELCTCTCIATTSHILAVTGNSMFGMPKWWAVFIGVAMRMSVYCV